MSSCCVSGRAPSLQLSLRLSPLQHCTHCAQHLEGDKEVRAARMLLLQLQQQLTAAQPLQSNQSIGRVWVQGGSSTAPPPVPLLHACVPQRHPSNTLATAIHS